MDKLSQSWENKQYMRYYIKECPFFEECHDSEAWIATNNCESYKCKQHVRDALRAHLQTPGVHHRLVQSQKCIDNAVANVEILEELNPGWKFKDYPPGPPYDIPATVVSSMVCQL